MSTSYIIQGCIGAIILLGMLIWLVIAIYLAKTRTTEFANYSPNSPLIKLKKPSRHDSAIVHFEYIGTLGACVTFPSRHIKRGELSAQDLLRLPPRTKQLLIALYCTRLGLIASLAWTYFVGKYGFDL